MGFLCRAFGGLVLLLLAGATAIAQQAPEKPVRVAVYGIQPYGGKGRDGVFAGASVDLWRRVAEHLNWQYQLTLVGHMEDVLAGVQAGTYDVAIGAITITPERLARVEFSYPTHRSGVAVVFPKKSGSEEAFWDYIDALNDLTPLILAMLILLLLIGLSMWWFERSTARVDKSQSSVASWHEGVYWAVVTMTTVGYGDKTPKTAVGRTLAVVWMVASLVMVSLLTTSLVARIAIDQVERLSTIHVSDLVGKRLAAVTESSGAEYLDTQRLAYQKFDDLPAAFAALAAKKADAVVNSVGALQYMVSTSFSEQAEPPHGLLAPAYMAFALPTNSALRKPLDRALIAVTATPEWRAVEETYFGK